MEQKLDRFYPSAPLEIIDLEQILEKKLKDVNSFNNSITNIKEMRTYFKDKNHKSKKKYKKYKILTTLIQSLDRFVIIATTSTFVPLRLSGNGSLMIPISTGIACGSTVSFKVKYEIVMQKYNKYKKQYEEYQQTIKLFDELYRRRLQDNVNDKSEYESPLKSFH